VRAQDPKDLIAFESVGSCGHFGYSDCGHETYVNALYVRNLRQMAELANELGDAEATVYQTRPTTSSKPSTPNCGTMRQAPTA